MKLKNKRIFLSCLAILDCIMCTGIIVTNIDLEKKDKDILLKTTGNFVVLEDTFDSNKDILNLVDISIAYQKKEQKRIEEENKIVYDGMTMKQLSNKLNRSLKGNLSGKGELIASYSLSKGVDPYVATAIMLHETGCEWGCSYLVKKCNNVGGQKGSGCGSYASFSSLDTGIKRFIDNLSRNYYSKGLNTPEKMNAKYAESKTWSTKVNAYVKKIRSK